MEPNILQVAAQLAQVLGWPIAFFLIWFMTRKSRNSDSDDEYKSLAYEFRNFCNSFNEQNKMHLEQIREINEALRLLVGSTARAEANYAKIEEMLRNLAR